MQHLREPREQCILRAQLADLAHQVIDRPEAAHELCSEPGLADAGWSDDRDERTVVREQARELFEILSATEEPALVWSRHGRVRHPPIVERLASDTDACEDERDELLGDGRE